MTDGHAELKRRLRSRKIRAEDARRVQVTLLLARGESFKAIATQLGCYREDLVQSILKCRIRNSRSPSACSKPTSRVDSLTRQPWLRCLRHVLLLPWVPRAAQSRR